MPGSSFTPTPLGHEDNLEFFFLSFDGRRGLFRIIQQNFQNFEVSFVEFVSFPITEGLNSSARVCREGSAPGGQWTHKLWGASTNFARFQVHQPSGFQTVYLCAGSGPISDNYVDKTKSPL
ncbi:hypothetical protein TNCV_2807641 [Trichonephila clavipes]|nr:hypothetical protein TNCV_2807641 [Trichonephila clavipes]